MQKWRWTIVNSPDVVVVDSVVTVIELLDNKCWLIAFIVFAMDDALLPILLNDIDDDVFWVEAVLDAVELFALLLFVPLLVLSLLFPLALLLLFRDARLLARADIRRFKSSRNSDFKGDTCRMIDVHVVNDKNTMQANLWYWKVINYFD